MPDDLFPDTRSHIVIAPGSLLLGGFALKWAKTLVQIIHNLEFISPFRHMLTPGGKTMSVAMSNCGHFGWITDQKGYRYSSIDPVTGRKWPPLPPDFLTLARLAASEAGYDDFMPDACLINRYSPGAHLTLHQDRDEYDLHAPVISVSLGLPATFLWGGLHRSDKISRHRLFHGDVFVWGGRSRLVFHGIDPVQPGSHPATGSIRYNLTFRKVM